MLTILSPAKKLSKDCSALTKHNYLPRFLDKSQELINSLKNMEPKDLESLMGISENLAVLNWERFQGWNNCSKPEESMEAVYQFLGDTYTGLDAVTLSGGDLEFAQKNTRILSGLYGVLRPLDLIMPYRLEMGTKLKNKIGNNLYDYWGDTLIESINQDLESHNCNILVNCASVEYFKSIDRPLLNAEVITPQFKEIKNGQLKMISFYAKRARGMMARFIIQNQIENKNEIRAFNFGGYRWDSSLSTPLIPVFTRASA